MVSESVPRLKTMVVRRRADVKYLACWDRCHTFSTPASETMHDLTTDGPGTMIGKLLLHKD